MQARGSGEQTQVHEQGKPKKIDLCQLVDSSVVRCTKMRETAPEPIGPQATTRGQKPYVSGSGKGPGCEGGTTEGASRQHHRKREGMQRKEGIQGTGMVDDAEGYECSLTTWDRITAGQQDAEPCRWETTRVGGHVVRAQTSKGVQLTPTEANMANGRKSR